MVKITPQKSKKMLMTIPKRFADRAAKKLTPREREVVEMLAGGETWKGISAALGISKSTIRAHTCSIRRKLGVPNTPAAVLALSR